MSFKKRLKWKKRRYFILELILLLWDDDPLRLPVLNDLTNARALIFRKIYLAKLYQNNFFLNFSEQITPFFR